MSTTFSLLLPEQPIDDTGVRSFGAVVADSPFERLWAGQSFYVESHMALSSLGREAGVPVAIGTALAALRTPFDAAMQARSLALLVDQEVSVAFGAADPAFVRGVTGGALKAPASYTAEYARLVRDLVKGRHAAGEMAGLTMSSTLPLVPHAPIRVGTGVLRAGMAAKSRECVDFVVTWLTPPAYVARTLMPALRRTDGTRPEVSTFVACAVDRPGRDPRLLVQRGCPHLQRAHYVDMLQQAGLDVHISDPISAARELVASGVFIFGSPDEIMTELGQYIAAGVDEIVLNLTPVRLLYGLEEALADAESMATALVAASVRA